METKFYKWVAPFSDTIDQVLMVYKGTSCRVNDFGENQMIQFYDYEADSLNPYFFGTSILRAKDYFKQFNEEKS